MKMKKTIAAVAGLLATTVAASAADMAVKARPIIPAEVWSWTGFYIGGHVGAGWGTTESTLTNVQRWPSGHLNFPLSLPFSQNSRSGFLGGGQVGANWQSGWAVFGVQGDIAGLDVKGTAPCLVVLGCTTESKWLASVTGRLGAVVADRGLIYVKGGAAWLNSDHRVTTPGFGPGAPVTTLTSANSHRLGLDPRSRHRMDDHPELDRVHRVQLLRLRQEERGIPDQHRLWHPDRSDGQRGPRQQALGRQGRRELQVRLGYSARREVLRTKRTLSCASRKPQGPSPWGFLLAGWLRLKRDAL